MMRHKRATGFTVIELLIVIVVIGVLAAITVVAYNGIQQRAENTKTTTAAKDWVKILMLYKSINGRYPTYSTADARGSYEQFPCLGTGYPDQKCMSLNNNVVVGAGVTYESDSFAAKIKPITAAASSPSTQIVMLSGEPHRGMFANLGGDGTTISIAYVLKGNGAQCADLGVGDKVEKARSSEGVYCGVNNLP